MEKNLITNEIKKPHDYQLKIFSEIKDDNSIIFMETGQGKTFLSVMMINQITSGFYMKQQDSKNKTNKKIIFLVCDVVLVEQQSKVIECNTNLRVKSFTGGKKMSKVLKSHEDFKNHWNQNDVFVSTPNIIYKILSIGYLKMSEIDLIILDECHHCNQDHPYNNLMNEFFLFYKLPSYNTLNLEDMKLPQILGLTASPIKKKLNKKDLDLQVYGSFEQLSENMDCKFIINPDMVKNMIQLSKEDNMNEDVGLNNIMKEIEKQYVEVESHLNQEENLQAIRFLKEELLIPMLRLIIANNPAVFDSNSSLYTEEGENFINDKFNCDDFMGYNAITQQYNYLYRLKDSSDLYKVFEKFQRQIFMLIENSNLSSVVELIQDYAKHFEDKDQFTQLDSSDKKDINDKILTQISKLLENFIENHSNLNFESDRLHKLKICLLEFLLKKQPGDDVSKLIIFVANRVVAIKLSNILNQFIDEEYNSKLDQDQRKITSVPVLGVNKKKAENSLEYKNSLSEINEKIKEFKIGDAQILVATSTVEEGLDVKACDTVIAYTSLHTPKSYIQMKGRARKSNAKFIFFTTNQKKMMSQIEEFIKVFKIMKSMFRDSIVRDFRRKNFLVRRNPLSYYHIIPKTHAKITLKNISLLFNEILQEFNNKNLKLKCCTKFNTTRAYSQKQKGSCDQFKCILTADCSKFDEWELDKEFQSDLFPDKVSAQNHSYLKFVWMLTEMNLLDGNFKLDASNL